MCVALSKKQAGNKRGNFCHRVKEIGEELDRICIEIRHFFIVPESIGFGKNLRK
jgi:hypothetical protein